MKQLPQAVGAMACVIAITCGVGFILDCRRSGGQVAECWVTGQNMINRAIDLGAGAGGGFLAGYWTLNPQLHKKKPDDLDAAQPLAAPGRRPLP